jgi:transcriptional regulator NrdR family protein
MSKYICSKCGCEKFNIVDSRNKTGTYVKRRRECTNCLNRLNTYEIKEEEYKILKQKEEELDQIKKYFTNTFINCKKKGKKQW